MNSINKGAFYVRQSRGGDWTAVSVTTPEDLDFPADVVADIVSLEKETSVWEVAALDAPEVGRLVAALHHENATNLSDMKLRFVSELDLNRLGFAKKQTKGQCLDSALNDSGKHWVVSTKTVRDAIQLAKSFVHIDEKYIGRDEVFKHFSVSILRGFIPPKKITHDLWKKLIEGGFIKLAE